MEIWASVASAANAYNSLSRMCGPVCDGKLPRLGFATGAELELASAGVMEYAPFPKFVPTHVTNFGSTTSRSAARRNHACAGPGPDFAVQQHSLFLLESWRRRNPIQNRRRPHLHV